MAKPKRMNKQVYGAIKNHASVHKRPKQCFHCHAQRETDKLQARGMLLP